MITLLARLFGKKVEKHGQCTVCGDETFLRHFENALKWVADTDPAVVEKINAASWMFVYSGKNSFLNIPQRIYGINDAWSSWREWGIATGLFYASALSEMSEHIKKDPHVDRLSALIATTKWMRRRNFPEELTCYLEHDDSGPMGAAISRGSSVPRAPFTRRGKL